MCDDYEDFDDNMGDYGDWLYECWKDRQLDDWLAQQEEQERRDSIDVMSDYEQRINRGVYE